jgi:hypothetical protein
MFQADITYVDEALHENKLSVVYDDLPAARVASSQRQNSTRHRRL